MAYTIAGGGANKKGSQQTTTQQTLVLTLGFTPTAGNLLVAWISTESNAFAHTVYDNIGTSGSPWTTDTTNIKKATAGNLIVSQVFYLKNCPGGITTVTLDCGAGHTDYLNLQVVEFAGGDTTAPLDAHSTNTAGSTNTITTGNFTPSVAGSLGVAANCNDSAGSGGVDTWSAITSGWTDASGSTLNSTAGYPLCPLYNLSVGASAQNPSVTFNGGTATFTAVGASFKPAASTTVTADMWSSPLPQPSRARPEMVGY